MNLGVYGRGSGFWEFKLRGEALALSLSSGSCTYLISQQTTTEPLYGLYPQDSARVCNAPYMKQALIPRPYH